MSRLSTVVFAASLASLAYARTDLTGCTSTDVSSPAGASIAWYVPGTGELCDFLDCGGGRAPPKTTVPGCPLYSGTATYSPSYLPGYGSMTASSSEATSTAATSSAAESYASASSSTSSGDDTSATDYSSATGASSETSETLDNSAVAITAETASSSAASTASGMTTITSSPAVVGAGSTSSNGTSTGSGSGSSGSGTNGTVSSGTPSPIMSNSGAMETARVWLGGSALVGLGALVAAL